MTTDGYLGLWESLEPLVPRPTLNRCPLMRRVWDLMMGNNNSTGRN